MYRRELPAALDNIVGRHLTDRPQVPPRFRQDPNASVRDAFKIFG